MLDVDLAGSPVPALYFNSYPWGYKKSRLSGPLAPSRRRFPVIQEVDTKHPTGAFFTWGCKESTTKRPASSSSATTPRCCTALRSIAD